jgi:hypothetical protein
VVGADVGVFVGAFVVVLVRADVGVLVGAFVGVLVGAGVGVLVGVDFEVFVRVFVGVLVTACCNKMLHDQLYFRNEIKLSFTRCLLKLCSYIFLNILLVVFDSNLYICCNR